MCFCIHFSVYSSYSNFIDEFIFLRCLVYLIFCLFLYTLCIWSFIVLFMWVCIHAHVSIKTLRAGHESEPREQVLYRMILKVGLINS
jgi:hypothetical protein